MGADIKTLRIRIKSVDSTLHLTKAMGLVASSKIRGATAAMLRSRDYSTALTAIVDQLSSCAECRKSPFVAGNESDKTKIIVIAGDRGLAGGYNSNIIKMAQNRINELNGNVVIIPIGKKVVEYFSKRNAKIFKSFENIAETMNMHKAMGIAEMIIDLYENIVNEMLDFDLGDK